MAMLHPSFQGVPTGAGAYRERDILLQLELGLPKGFDVFHNLDWMVMLDSSQRVGEVDVAVVNPAGHLLLLEVKAGAVEESADGIRKSYGSSTRLLTLDVGQQARRNQSGILTRLKEQGLDAVRVGTMLVLPDHHVKAETLAFTRDRIVDAAGMENLCAAVQGAFDPSYLPPGTRGRLLEFLGGRFSVVPDVSVHVGQIRACSVALASGLATWVPCVHHASGIYAIQATAGSGKTQLALALMRQAHLASRRAAYVCFNRPLADHMAALAPSSAVAMTFHEVCLESARRLGEEPDFASPQVFTRLEEVFLAEVERSNPRWDLLILDETQDLESEWVAALVGLLRQDGSAYLLGDAGQQVYDRGGFDSPEAVCITCTDNFRSPRRVVDAINHLRLAPSPVVARSPYQGSSPGFHTYAAGKVSVLTAVEHVLGQLMDDGLHPEQIVVLSFSGREKSAVLQQTKIAGLSCRRPTGRYDSAGNALWSAGELLVDTVYRFKGQSAPAVILCEIDFEAMDEKTVRKLFVGFTRAQFRLECVLSERAAQALMERADAGAR